MKSKGIIGKEVVGSGGWTIGEVRDIVFDETNWRIGSLEVKLDRSVAEEYQMKKLLTRATLTIDVASVRAVGDHIMLSVTKPELGHMVSFRKP